jgi:hypothetical protein
MSSSHGADDHIQRLMRGQSSWEEVPISQEVITRLPQTPDHIQRCWNQFFREFMADVNGEGYTGYPTFRDGYTAVAITDIARKGYDWQVLHSVE